MRVPVLSFWPSALLSGLLFLGAVVLDYGLRPAPKIYDQVHLNLSLSKLVELAPNASNYTQLEGITLVIRAEDRAIPRAIQAFAQIKRLSIIGTKDYCSLEGIRALKQLRILEVQSIYDHRMVDHAATLPLLEELHIHYCSLRRLSPNLSQLHQLRALDVAYNELTLAHYLEDIMLLPQLKALRLDGNPIQVFPERLLQHHKLRYLSMQGCELAWTESVASLPDTAIPLAEIYLDNNELNQLPLGIAQLYHLQHFSISYNKLDMLPARLVASDRLEQLDLSNNLLNQLPNEWVKGDRLRYINLSKNKLTALPEGAHHSNSLIYLNVSFNDLTFDSDFLNHATALRQLNLYGNDWDELPASLYDLPHLEMVAMQNKPTKEASFVVHTIKTFNFDPRWQWQLLESYSTQPNSPLHQIF